MTRICLSVGRVEDLQSDAMQSADMAELRLDMTGWPLDPLPEKPFIATLGGLEGQSRAEAAEWALSAGAELIDVGDGDDAIDEGRKMASHHDWERTPSWEEILRLLGGMRGGLRKGAFMVNSLRDLVNIKQAADLIAGRHVMLGMGELGVITRIRSQLLGNEFTYAHGGKATAPGQLSAQEMRRLGGDALLLGIVGRPLGHSSSPAMHRAAMDATGLAGRYLRLDVPDLDGLAAFMKFYDVRGLNVTIPYKVEALAHLDALDASAAAVGAVNTISNEDGRLVGYNTDVLGVKEALSEAGLVIEGSEALVLGAGGAAMACCHALLSEGCGVTVSNRDMSKAEALAQRFGCSAAGVPRSLERFDLIVNCTPLGMEGYPSLAPLEVELIGEGHTVFDMVYRPRETPLIREASARGARTIEGAEMLLHQAMASFRIWTGLDAPKRVMMEAIL